MILLYVLPIPESADDNRLCLEKRKTGEVGWEERNMRTGISRILI